MSWATCLSGIYSSGSVFVGIFLAVFEGRAPFPIDLQFLQEKGVDAEIDFHSEIERFGFFRVI